MQCRLICKLAIHTCAGQMLYLPAGWFHQVTSRTAPGGTCHLAFNYWFHPPDNLDPSAAGYDSPYRTMYWPSLWAQRMHRPAANAFAAQAVAGMDNRGIGEGSVWSAHSRDAAADEKRADADSELYEQVTCPSSPRMSHFKRKPRKPGGEARMCQNAANNRSKDSPSCMKDGVHSAMKLRKRRRQARQIINGLGRQQHLQLL